MKTLEILRKSLDDYRKGTNQAKDTRTKSTEYIQENYKAESKVYSQALDEVEKTFNDTIKVLRDSYKTEIENAIESLKKELSDCVNLNGSADLPIMKLLDGTFSDVEKDIILEKYDNNYLVCKYFNRDNKHFTTLEDALKDVDLLESEFRAVLSYSDINGYSASILLNTVDENGKPVETYLDESAKRIDSFLEKYSGK